MDCSIPGLPVHRQLLEFTQTHVHWVGDAIQPSHPLSSPSPPTFSLSQHQGFFKWVSFLHQVAKVLEFGLQHQSFQWTFRTDFLQDWLVWFPCNLRNSQESPPVVMEVCILSRLYMSPCLFNLYAECIMWNAGLDEAQTGIKIAWRNINNLRFADDTTLMAESKEELKNLLMKWKGRMKKLV